MTKAIIDLYAGVGGLSLGAARAGFRIAAAVELDPYASAAHALNFPATVHISEDVSALSGRQLLRLAGLRSGELTGLIGGPPCQGFSEIGLGAKRDPRNRLLAHFFRLVAETRPAFFLAENVPGLLHPKNARRLRDAMRHIPAAYTRVDPIVVRASDYGAPTSRTRIFFMGFDSRRVNALNADTFLPDDHGPDVRVRGALRGLPSVQAHWLAEAQGWRSVRRYEETSFDSKVWGEIPPGVGDNHSISLLHKKSLVSGFLGTVHSDETIQRFGALEYGQRDSVSKATRLDPTSYCPTLRAGTAADRGSFQAVRPVHYRSPRVIAPREAARLQGFPDWFQFHATKWHAFRQIGNSVSPIAAEALFSSLFQAAD